MKSIGTRLFAVIGVFTIIFSAFVLFRTYTITDSHFRNLVSQQADLALQFDLSIRKYVAEKIRPIMYELVGTEEFIPESMSTSFVARSIFDDVRKAFPEFILKFSSKDPRNPANQAGPAELEIIDYFNKHPSENRWSGPISINNRQFMAVFEARRMDESCLRCHGKPLDAPASLLERYGDIAGFHRPMDEVIAMDTIAIPMNMLQQALWRDLYGNFMILGLGIMVFIFTMYLTVRHFITNRLATITSHFVRAAEQTDYLRIEPINVKGRDEVSDLARSYNTLAKKLHNYHLSLENQIREKTRANELLENEIEERLKTVMALRKAENKYRGIFVNAMDGIYQSTFDGDLVSANPAFARLLGFDNPEELIKSVHNVAEQLYVNPADRLELIKRLENEGSVRGFETQLYKKDGSIIWLNLNTRRSFDDSRRKDLIDGVVQDITARKQAESDLAAEKERLAVTLQSIGDGVITTDTGGRVVLLNREAQKLTGWSPAEARGLPLAEVFNIMSEKTRRPQENPATEVLQTGRVVELANHTVLVARDGTERFIADSGAPIFDSSSEIIGVVLVFRDVTEKQRLEKEIGKIQKLESLGTLAGGIAHDFNNIMTVIIGNITLAKLNLTPGHPAHENLTESENAVLRARDLTQQLLTFSRGGAPIKTVVSIAEIVKESARFTLRGSNVKCEFDFAPDLLPVEVDSGQMNQVINNLVLNADQAMPDGGSIRISIQNTSVPLQSHLPLEPGAYVMIIVNDNGPGIPAEHLPNIFDPYFTTKKTGSGLGLSTVYSIISKHNGHMTVESSSGAGTTFHLYLPTTQQKPVPAAAVPDLIIGQGRILIMEDEATVSKAAGEILKRLGYSVDFAADGREAIDKYRESLATNAPFDAVIMDLTVPGGMGGREATARLLEIDPQARVIVSSGFSSDPVMANHKDYGFVGVVAKPYHIRELSVMLHRVLKD